ncbi:hypothetical protein ACOWZZ_10230, partial [Klebsiella pneumoniae]
QTETEATGAPQKHHYTLNQQVGSITEFDSFLLCTPMSSNLNNKRIPPQDFVCNLSHARQGVIDSIDTLITNC